MKVNKIDSRDNPRLKLIRKVRSGRDRERIFVEGVRLAREALNSGIKLEFCFISRDLADNRLDQALVRSISRSTQVYELPESLFASAADTANSQGIILIGDRPAADRETFSEAIKAHRDQLPI